MSGDSVRAPLDHLALAVQSKLIEIGEGATVEDALRDLVDECVDAHVALENITNLPRDAMQWILALRMTRKRKPRQMQRRRLTPAACTRARLVCSVVPGLIQPVRAKGVGADPARLWTLLVMMAGGMKAPQVGRVLWAGAPMAAHSGNRNLVHDLRRDVFRSIADRLSSLMLAPAA
ncbi:MAG: hypothetical protein K2Y27_00845 [Xanthobacteraceae bacterium]|nr:hypothetical protein [Xanthobacteraceae bacterium]